MSEISNRFEHIKETLIKRLKIKEPLNTELPAFPQLVATLQYRERIQRYGFSVVIVLLLLMTAFLIIDRNKAIERANSKEFFVIPATLPNVLKVRANILSDEQVYEFAEWFTGELTNVNYEDAPARYKTLQKYMHPSLKADFKRRMKSKIELWQARQIDQSYVFGNIDKFERSTKNLKSIDESGKELITQRTVFKTSVWGTVRKYVEGRPVTPYREKIALEFTTGPITGDKTWLFEVTDISRITWAQLEKEKQAKGGSF